MKIWKFIAVIIIVGILLYCTQSCTNYSHYRPELPPEVPVIKTYLLKGHRYQYKAVETRWFEDGYNKWYTVLYATCIKPDDALPSHNFVAKDYGYNGRNIDEIVFEYPTLVSGYERDRHYAQAFSYLVRTLNTTPVKIVRSGE